MAVIGTLLANSQPGRPEEQRGDGEERGSLTRYSGRLI